MVVVESKGKKMKQFLTVKEAAQLLRVGESTLYGLAQQGKLPRYKIGASVRFELSELLECARASEKQPEQTSKVRRMKAS